MSNKPVKHHVAPAAYLNNFARLSSGQKSPRICVLQRSTGEIEHSIKTKDIVYKNFYDHLGSDGSRHSSAEERLNKEIENPGHRVLQAVINEERLGWKQIIHLGRYVLVSLCRSIWLHHNLRATIKVHSSYHGYSEEHAAEIAHHKQVELLRGLMGLRTDTPNVHKDDPILSQIFRTQGSLELMDSKLLTMKLFTSIFLSRRRIVISSAPVGTEFITSDNFVVPILEVNAENYLDIPFHAETKLFMPINPNLCLKVDKVDPSIPNSMVVKRNIDATQVDEINRMMCVFSSGHIFSTNSALLAALHSRVPHQNTKAVELNGKVVATSPYPKELPQKFGSQVNVLH